MNAVIDHQAPGHSVGLQGCFDGLADSLGQVRLARLVSTESDELDYIFVHLTFQVVQIVLLGHSVYLSVWEHGLVAMRVRFV